MEIKAKTISTPAGVFPAPLDPHFAKELAKCDTKKDLFQLVETREGFIVPDAMNEVVVRGWYNDYFKWSNETRHPMIPPTLRYKNTIIEGVRPGNNLAIVVKENLIREVNEMNSGGISMDVTYWKQRAELIAHDAHQSFPRCSPLHLSTWTDMKDTFFLGLYRSYQASINSGPFLTIKCSTERPPF